MRFKRWIFFLNSEFLCFTLFSNLVKKFICQTLRRWANLEKTNLIHQMTYKFCIFDSLDMFLWCIDTKNDSDALFWVVCLTVRAQYPKATFLKNEKYFLYFWQIYKGLSSSGNNYRHITTKEPSKIMFLVPLHVWSSSIA